MKVSDKRKNNGGTRPGSGRPKKEKTSPIRVPNSLHPLINLLKELHEDGYSNEKKINEAIELLKGKSTENQLSLI